MASPPTDHDAPSRPDAALPALPRVPRRRWLTVTLVVCVVLLGLSLAATRWIKSPQQARAETAPPAKTTLTAEVERRVLTLTQVIRGDVVAVDEVQFTPAAAVGATKLVVSALGVRQGGKVAAGQAVAAVSGRPVLALQGAVPAYRDMKVGDRGPDVVQLQRALRRIGLDAGAAGIVDKPTIAAVRTLYQRSGYALPSPATDTGDVLAPADELAFVPRLPGTLLRGPATLGAAVEPPFVTISSGSLSIRSQIDPTAATVVKPGLRVDIGSEILGESAHGTVRSVTMPTERAGQQGDGAPSTPIVIVEPDQPLATEWNGQNVRVTIQAARTEGPVLVVPASAVTTGTDGTTSVQRMTAGGGSGERTTVSIGLDANGYFEVRPLDGMALRQGDLVQIGLT